MSVYVMVSARPTVAPSVRPCRSSENFNAVILSDTVKRLVIALLSEFKLFRPLSVLTRFQGHISVEQLQLEFLCSYPVKLTLSLSLTFARIQGR